MRLERGLQLSAGSGFIALALRYEICGAATPLIVMAVWAV